MSEHHCTCDDPVIGCQGAERQWQEVPSFQYLRQELWHLPLHDVHHSDEDEEDEDRDAKDAEHDGVGG